ncbi:TIGR03621 family F420-dependent LLM class oxidoreductase [Ruania rhizosphaerae]|uniref:TIGR03621 family F420-dependent LLM class oxidoreductase n=1 Tax=Ruania rhizosphaerae TaxID=1840413 RepID=UPI0013591D1A
MSEIRISVQAEPRDLNSWLALARRLEASGFEALLMGDHPGSGASPWPALGAAAAVTSTLRLGTCVLQTGVREPLQVATDAATLDALAPGRVILGLGAGHTFREWEVSGRRWPSPADRIGRLAEFVPAVAQLLDGEHVTATGRFLELDDAVLEDVPATGRVRIAVGGAHPELLRLAARTADVVGLSGLGRTLPDGHRHEVRWSKEKLRAQLAIVQDESARTGTAPEVEALVQVVTETDDRRAVLTELAERLPGSTADDLAQAPFLLVGTREDMAAQLKRQARELGIARYVVRESALVTMEKVIALLDS